MTDDIVTQLRERAVILFSNGADGNAFIDEQAAAEIERLRIELGKYMGDCLMFHSSLQALQARLNKAMRGECDEIERLRTLADNLAHQLQGYVCHCGMSKCKCGYDEVMNEYYEVRGE